MITNCNFRAEGPWHPPNWCKCLHAVPEEVIMHIAIRLEGYIYMYRVPVSTPYTSYSLLS